MTVRSTAQVTNILFTTK